MRNFAVPHEPLQAACEQWMIMATMKQPAIESYDTRNPADPVGRPESTP